MKDEQKRMVRMVEEMQKFWNTYPDQTGYMDYSDETFIADALYGIGIAVSDEYRFADGFAKFKKRLTNGN